MKRGLLVPVITVCVLSTFFHTPVSLTAYADSKNKTTTTTSGTYDVFATSEDPDINSTHTYSTYYAQGYSNALMGLQTYANGQTSYHIANVKMHNGHSLCFSFYGNEDFVGTFGTTSDTVMIEGNDDAYIMCVSEAQLVQSPSLYNIDSFSSFLTPSQYFTSDQVECFTSEDGLNSLLRAKVTEIIEGRKYSGYLMVLSHSSSYTGILLTYMMPDDSYDEASVLTFAESVAFADDTFASSLETSTAVADAYTSESSLETLCKTGYFNYKPLSSENFTLAQQLVKPSLIELFHADSEDSPNGWSGSGVIYDITPDYIYFISVAHVLDRMREGNNELWLYDGTRITFSNAIKYTRLSTENELCLFRLSTDYIPMRILTRLREISVNPNIYSQIPEGAQLLGIATNYKHTGKDLITPMTLLKINDTIPENKDASIYLTATLALQDGMSGTAVIDMRGNLVGIADAKNLTTNKSYALMIDNILSFDYSKLD
ncbi:hypothetical protein SAMN02745229_00313 [Butyrivibrio fibrisolvens DSM 3071]|uniref:Trypsin-like peptidase domain-containing protein n=1 Tax=Butyrivibrio fibrisolvens DSM 3071 TaxID=1121131 RepID=A0A1M5QH79_BUTFI|nr:serine protease [Butyrivibrio fibrisolvens]SHH13170.1 hypothetical protein SAMN02745229_00313 [Butyrivibrio fibrisolvens DSM 3071]